MATEKHTEYAVARVNEVITEWADLATAQANLAAVENGMRNAYLEPDVHLVESDVEVTTKRSRAKAVEVPEPAEAPAPDGDGTPQPGGPAVVLPPSGIWGDDDGSVAAAIAADQAAQGGASSTTTVVSTDGTPTDGSTKGDTGGTGTS